MIQILLILFHLEMKYDNLPLRLHHLQQLLLDILILILHHLLLLNNQLDLVLLDLDNYMFLML
jgi:hypothetical protein